MQLILSIFLAIFLLLSCEDPIAKPNNNGKPFIERLSALTSYYNDTLVVYGNNFSYPRVGSFIVINDTIKIKSQECIEWTDNRISVLLKSAIDSSKIKVVVNQDTSNRFGLTVRKIKPIEFTIVPSNIYIMGSANGFDDELPQRFVIIPDTLIVAKFEISNRVYSSIMNTELNSEPNNPVEYISWVKAVEFCNALSEYDGFTKPYKIDKDIVDWDTTSNGWRLPTEAEWEYFTKSNTTTDYYSNELNAIAWYNLNSGYKTQEVGKKQPNGFGLYDLTGNVWEWCWDYYSENYYSLNVNFNPKGPTNGNKRVLRGGAYNSGTAFLRSSNRKNDIDTNTYKACGIRLVRSKK